MELDRIGAETIYGKEAGIDPLAQLRGLVKAYEECLEITPENKGKYPEPLPLPNWSQLIIDLKYTALWLNRPPSLASNINAVTSIQCIKKNFFLLTNATMCIKILFMTLYACAVGWQAVGG